MTPIDPLPAEPAQPFVVLKFGGTSVSTSERWATIATVARARVAAGELPVLVCSATAGTSDLLVAWLDAYADPAVEAEVVAELDARHRQLAATLGVDPDLALDVLAEVRERVTAARALGELSPRVRASVLACGEVISTRLGAAYLVAAGLDVRWVDARTLLDAAPTAPHDPSRWLSATCDYAPDPAIQQRLRADGAIVLTQGFVARDPETGDRAVLGRGGSDTSAAYLASRLAARRLEIWTDVDGLYSAHPGVVADARRLDEVSYAEAEAAASLGARVLHPRCLAPVRDAGVELVVRRTADPQAPGTRVLQREARPGVCAVVHRPRLNLVRVRRPAQWQEVGVLADLASVFRTHGVSMDLVATAPGVHQVTLDPSATPMLHARLPALLADLSELGEAELLPDVSSVSLVGVRLSEALAELGGVLGELTDHQVGLVDHGADDAHFTVVVPRADVDEVVRRVHRLLFGGVDRVVPEPVVAEAPRMAS